MDKGREEKKGEERIEERDRAEKRRKGREEKRSERKVIEEVGRGEYKR